MPAIKRYFRFDRDKGKVVESDKPQPKIHRCSTAMWPYHSEALGVDPSQIPEATAHLRQHGVMADFDPQTGAMVASSEKQVRDAAKASGLFNGRDGYGVPDAEGNMTGTGREPVKDRERLKEQINKDLPDGETVDDHKNSVQFADPSDDD